MARAVSSLRIRGAPLLLCALMVGCVEPEGASLPEQQQSLPLEPSIPHLEFVGSTGPTLDLGELTYFDVQADGRILALDQTTSLLHLLEPDGSHLTIGGRGRGPEDLQGPNGVASLDDGSFVVLDAGNGRITGWDRDGRPLGHVIAHPLASQRLDAQGARVFLTSRAEGVSEVGPGYDLVLLHWEELEGPPRDSLSLLSSDLLWDEEVAPDTVSCGPCPFVALDENRVALARPGSYLFQVVRVLDGKVLAQFGRPDLPRVRHSPRSWAAEQERTIASVEMMERRILGRVRSGLRDRVRDRSVPEPLPYMSYLARPFPLGVDERGMVWVLRNTPEDALAELDVFGPDFDFLGTVKLMGHDLTSIRVRGNFLAARSEDTMGVAEVRLYRIVP